MAVFTVYNQGRFLPAPHAATPAFPLQCATLTQEVTLLYILYKKEEFYKAALLL